MNILRPLEFYRVSSTTKRANIVGKGGSTLSFGYSHIPFKSDGYTKASKEYHEAFDDLGRWFRKYYGGKFEYNCIFVNKDRKALKHKDMYNCGDSVFLFTGDLESAGELMIYDDVEEDKVIQTVPKNTFVKFNGYKHFHETKDFEGERYSVIFYKNLFYETHKALQNYVIAIPSYKRAEILKRDTLATLQKHRINPKQIMVYVSSIEEKREYEKVLNPDTYNFIKIGDKGLVQNRAQILADYPTNYRILMLDDDIVEIDLGLDDELKGFDLDEFIKYGFEIAEMNGAYLWGVYPVYNPFFRETKSHYTLDLKYVVGCWTGIVNRWNDKDLELSISKATDGNKEDVERTILFHKKDGVVLRFNKVGLKTKYYGTDGGGLGTLKTRLKKMKIASYKLQTKYPNYGKVVARKNGLHEFKLKLT